MVVKVGSPAARTWVRLAVVALFPPTVLIDGFGHVYCMDLCYTLQGGIVARWRRRTRAEAAVVCQR